MSQQPKLWRTLVRVTVRREGWIGVTIPARAVTDEQVFISLAAFRPMDRNKLQKNYRCYAKVNIDVENKYDLVFEDWELP